MAVAKVVIGVGKCKHSFCMMLDNRIEMLLRSGNRERWACSFVCNRFWSLPRCSLGIQRSVARGTGKACWTLGQDLGSKYGPVIWALVLFFLVCVG